MRAPASRMPSRRQVRPAAAKAAAPHGRFADVWRRLAELATDDLDPDDPASRDPEFIDAVAPFFDLVGTYYFRTEVEGAEHVPPRGPFIAVANHNGGPILPDVWMTLAYWAQHMGTDVPAYAMVHDAAFRVPLVRNFLAKLGGMRASRANAEKVLERGGVLLVYPGGELDCLRSFWERNTINLHGRTGFIELALQFDVPILPVVNIGAHEVYFTLWSSRRLAKWSGIEWLTRVKTVPLTLGLPWGLWLTGFVPYWPLPSKFVYKVGRPMRFHATGGHGAAIQRAYARITATMQKMLDDLSSRRRLPVIG